MKRVVSIHQNSPSLMSSLNLYLAYKNMLYIIPVKESNTQKNVGGEFKEPTDVTR
jgi:hypothetical protein